MSPFLTNATIADLSSQAAFRHWSKANDFQSKLPGDVKKRKEALAKITEEQKTLDSHLKDMSKQQRVIKYSELVFARASVDWLIGTDQVCMSNFSLGHRV